MIAVHGPAVASPSCPYERGSVSIPCRRCFAIATAELAKLAQQIKADRVKALFLDSITDPRAMQRIAGETGAVVGGTLYDDAPSPDGGETAISPCCATT